MLYSPGNLTSMDLTAEDRPRTVRFLSRRARAQAQGRSERRIAREEERRERKRVDDGGRRRKGESSTWESEQTTAVPSERVGAALAPARSRHRDPSRLDPRLGAASVYFLHRRRQKNDFVGDHCDRRCVRPLHSATSSQAPKARSSGWPIATDVRIGRCLSPGSRRSISRLVIFFIDPTCGSFIRIISLPEQHVGACCSSAASRNGGKSQENLTFIPVPTVAIALYALAFESRGCSCFSLARVVRERSEERMRKRFGQNSLPSYCKSRWIGFISNLEVTHC